MEAYKKYANPNEFEMTKKELEDAFTVFQPPTDEEAKAYDYFKQHSV